MESPVLSLRYDQNLRA